MTDQRFNNPSHAYKVISTAHEHHLGPMINTLAADGWEPFLFSCSANVKPSVSGTGRHGCVMRKPFDQLTEYEKARIAQGYEP